MFQASAAFFDRLMRRYTPDPFLLALLLTLIIFIMGFTITHASAKEMVLYWGDGFWNLTTFTLQMVMILVSGYVVALAPPIKRILCLIAKWVKTPGQALIVVTLGALTASLINWGLGLVVGGLLCREIIKSVPTANFRLMVAGAYSGFLVWHGGISGSIPLVIATPGNFSEKLIGHTIPISETLLSPFNIIAVVGLFILLPITNWLMGRNTTPQEKVHIENDEVSNSNQPKTPTLQYPADRLENNRLVSVITALMGFTYIAFRIMDKKFAFDINDINFIFLFLAILLHGYPRSFIDAITEAAKRVGPILLQFPFYAGIMGMMSSSKLADIVSSAFLKIATPETFPLLAFYSAGLVNLFVPSGGGQWAIQAPIMIDAAKELDVSLSQTAMAVAWGDAWTNMLQPFWALPLLAIAGLNLRDIMGYCVTTLLVSGAFLSVLFLVVGYW